jgi:predicted Zn-dependent protease
MTATGAAVARTIAGALVLALLFGVAGCTMNPVSGRPSVVLTSVEQERQMGRKVASQLDYYVGLTDAPTTTAYVTDIGKRLVSEAPGDDFHYTFQVLEMTEPNAMALPGGYVYISRGLLVLLNSEAELAKVLGHEIIQIAARHSGQSVARAAPISLVTGIGAMAGSIVSPAIGRAVAGVGSAAGGVMLAPYSRDQEYEADAEGQKLAAAAGYDPAAMSEFLGTLELYDAMRRAEAGKEAEKDGWLSTHPSTPKRARETGKRARSITITPRAEVAPSRKSFLARLDGLPVGENAAEGIFEGRLFMQPDLNFAVRFPDDWITHNARHMLAAQSKDGAATIILEGVAEGDDPLTAAHQFEEQTQVYLDKGARRRKVGTLEAAGGTADVEVSGTKASAAMTWIAYGGIVYRVTGISTSKDFPTYESTFQRVAESFRPMTEAERAGIRQTRLRVREAHAGETIEQFRARTGSVWSVGEVAVANGLAEATPLSAGQLLKVAILERY